MIDTSRKRHYRQCGRPGCAPLLLFVVTLTGCEPQHVIQTGGTEPAPASTAVREVDCPERTPGSCQPAARVVANIPCICMGSITARWRAVTVCVKRSSRRKRSRKSVHWHGMELQSVYDGVAGWSRTDSRVAPLLAPGDSFDVFIRPPRAGTFIYHSHMDELRQVTQGMYGPLLVLVLEPGQRFDPERDRLIVIADAIDGDYHATSGSPVVLGECIAEAVADIPDVRFARQCGMIVHRAPFHSQKAAWTPSCIEYDLSSVSPCSWPPRPRWQM